MGNPRHNHAAATSIIPGIIAGLDHIVCSPAQARSFFEQANKIQVLLQIGTPERYVRRCVTLHKHIALALLDGLTELTAIEFQRYAYDNSVILNPV